MMPPPHTLHPSTPFQQTASYSVPLLSLFYHIRFERREKKLTLTCRHSRMHEAEPTEQTTSTPAQVSHSGGSNGEEEDTR